MQVVLVMFRSDGERRSFSVTRDITVIGRREDCDLRIPLGEVSRKHARLVRDGDTIKVEDLGSSNGTYLNGQRMQESLLAPGDTVQVGPVAFVVQMDGVPADEELHPVMMEPSAGGADIQEPADYAEAGPQAGTGAGAGGGAFEPSVRGDDMAAGEENVELQELEDLEPLDEQELGPADFEDAEPHGQQSR